MPHVCCWVVILNLLWRSVHRIRWRNVFYLNLSMIFCFGCLEHNLNEHPSRTIFSWFYSFIKKWVLQRFPWSVVKRERDVTESALLYHWSTLLFRHLPRGKIRQVLFLCSYLLVIRSFLSVLFVLSINSVLSSHIYQKKNSFPWWFKFRFELS